MRIASGQIVAEVELDALGLDFRRAEVRFEGLRPPMESFELRVFLDEPHPDARTPTLENPRYLGSQWFYGLGAGAPPEPRGIDAASGPTQSSPRTIVLNVTSRLRAYLRDAAPHRAPLAVAAVDKHGAEIGAPDLDVEGVSIVTS